MKGIRNLLIVLFTFFLVGCSSCQNCHFVVPPEQAGDDLDA